MKKKLSLLLVFVASFMTSVISVDAIPDACDHKKIYTETYYEETEWNVWVNVCDPVCDGVGYSACMDDEASAKNWCKHEYRTKTYKGSYHLVQTGECSQQSICGCYTYGVTCNFSNPCTNWVLDYDKDNDGVYDKNDGDTQKCTSYKFSTWSGTSKVTVSGEGGKCATEETKASSSAMTAACQAAYPNRNVTGVSQGSLQSTQYQVKYPLCTCKSKKYLVENMREAKYYTESETGEKIPAYCINPADEAPDDDVGANQYTVDVTSCESSNSTPDCGYANIMIEGYYRYHLKNNKKYTYSVIGAAMRLWGAHVGASGYTDTGIADEDDNTEPPSIDVTPDDDNGVWLKFVPDSSTKKYVNVFKETSKFMIENATNNGYRPGLKDIYDVNTRFDASMNIETITCNNNRMGVFCGTGVEHSDYLYSLLLYVNTVQGNPDMQDHLDEILVSKNPDYVVPNDPAYASANILTDTKVKITYTLRKGVEIDCNTLDDDTANDLGCQIEQKIIIKTVNGEIVTNVDSYDYCKKNYCYVTIEIDKGKITCDIAEKITIEVPTYQSCTDYVKKYVSCSSPSDTQIMFSFDPNRKCDEYEGKPTRKVEPSLNCDACNDPSTLSIPNCDVNSNSQEYVTRTAGDPSLNCILHKSSLTESTNQNGKRYYDYSNMFGVNTNICKVYCSDKVTYYMAPKEDVYSGLQLKYDIESRVFPSRTNAEKSSHALTSIVQVKRDCVSEIFYDDIIFDYAKNWETAYGVSGEIHNWKDLYNAIFEKSATQNNRKEVLNELIYDLYSCNFFSNSVIFDKTNDIISQPKNSKNAYKVATDILNNTDKYCENNDCVTGSITYEGGAKYMAAQDTYFYTGQNGKDPALSSEESVYNGLNVKYCNKDECFTGSKNGKFEEDYSNAHSSQENDLVKWNKKSDGSYTKVKVPTNDYAIFSYSMEADLYNSTRYQLEEYTGSVNVVKNDNYDDKLLTLDKYLYPIALSVKNRCEYINDYDSVNNGKYLCDVNYNINIPVITKYNSLSSAEQKNVGTIAFYRNYNNDDLTDNLNKAAKYSCAYTVDDKTTSGKGFIFRNIDLNDPVPVERDGTNWDSNNSSSPEYSKYVSEVIEEIKQSGKDNLYATDYYLEYSYELTPDSIEKIRSYNDDHSYFEKVIYGSCSKQDNMNLNCRSQFLRDLHSNSSSYGVMIYKDDGKSQFTIDKERYGQGGVN